jgi:hypothetical protein
MAYTGRVSKSAHRTTSQDQPIWKSAIQQVWKPALRARFDGQNIASF